MANTVYVTTRSRSAAMLCCLLLFGCLGSRSLHAQENATIEDDTALAIKVYETGNVKAAIGLLRAITEKRGDDADAWRYLGIAYKDEGKFMLAGPALRKYISLRPGDGEAHALVASILVMGSDIKTAGLFANRAIDLGIQNADVHYVLSESNLEAGNAAQALVEADTALRLDPNCVDALLTKARALRVLKRDRESIDALSGFLSASPNADDAELWREDLARWQAGLQLSRITDIAPNPVVYNPGEVTTKARIINKPSPNYTEKARNAQITGTVVLQIVLSSTGEVTDISVIQRLRGGLTTEAVKAARGIRFEPAIRDGHPVSQHIRIEYNFNVY